VGWSTCYLGIRSSLLEKKTLTFEKITNFVYKPPNPEEMIPNLQEKFKKAEEITKETKVINMKDDGMTFHDAILRFSNFHSIEPEYVYPGYKGTPIDKEYLQKLIEEFIK
jgi:hypothetical protein